MMDGSTDKAMSEKERMLAGRLYIMKDELPAAQKRARRLVRAFNATTEEQPEEREALLKELFGSWGKGGYVEPPFRCDYGSHIHIGDGFYANYDCIIIDVCPVHIGNNVFFGPRVGVYTAGHPIDAGGRNRLLEFGAPITIGDSVWVGGNTVINPGVSIGDNTVIGSGSVVTKDIPANVVAVGNPCRVLRPITEKDREYWLAQAGVYDATPFPRPGHEN